MPYVNATHMLRCAQRGGYAVGQMNLNNLESIRVLLEAAEEARSPLMLGVSGGVAKRLGGYGTIAAVVQGMMAYAHITIPVCLHADHSTWENALAALEAGFSSIMYDGSRLPLAENLAQTRLLVELGHARGASVEAEVGPVAGHEDGGDAAGELADVEECGAVAALGVDMLAAGIGNIHGAYPPDWKGLDFDLLQRIRERVGDVPLVLHGGSGIGESSIRRAIGLGVCKINVNAECREAFAQATCQFVLDGRAEKDAAHTQLIQLQPGLEAVKAVSQQKMRLFGCAGQA